MFGDDMMRVRPIINFSGQGKVKVCFKIKACCDEEIMKEWASIEWGDTFKNPLTAGFFWKIIDNRRL